MPQQRELTKEYLSLSVSGIDIELSALHCSGELPPLVFLHGFGSTKEDYADVVRHPEFAGRMVLAYDAPGCGETVCRDLSKISIPFLVDTALAVLDHFGIQHFHLVGHSMGGLTSLMLAHLVPERVLSFIDIEGNVAPEDCFLSRQIVSHHTDNDERFFDEFIRRAWHSPYFSSPLYAASLRHKVRAGAVRGIFESMVELSDTGDLMGKFLGLQCPRMFMYGEQNASLSYLKQLQSNGVDLAEIPLCGHFPMYSNAPVMWERISRFLAQM